MKIEKLPSGSYRIRKMHKGQMYTVVFNEKPTQKEAMQAMAAEPDKIKSKKIPSNIHRSCPAIHRNQRTCAQS